MVRHWQLHLKQMPVTMCYGIPWRTRDQPAVGFCLHSPPPPSTIGLPSGPAHRTTVSSGKVQSTNLISPRLPRSCMERDPDTAILRAGAGELFVCGWTRVNSLATTRDCDCTWPALTACSAACHREHRGVPEGNADGRKRRSCGHTRQVYHYHVANLGLAKHSAAASSLHALSRNTQASHLPPRIAPGNASQRSLGGMCLCCYGIRSLDCCKRSTVCIDEDGTGACLLRGGAGHVATAAAGGDGAGGSSSAVVQARTGTA